MVDSGSTICSGNAIVCTVNLALSTEDLHSQYGSVFDSEREKDSWSWLRLL